MERGKIRIIIGEDGVSWSRGEEGISVRSFIETYPCLALRYLAGGGRSNQLGEAILSTIGGLSELQEFNRTHLCGEEENLIQQI